MGVEVQGDLILKGAKTTLDLYSKDFFSTHALQESCILGALHNRMKVSLVDCITTQGLGSGSRGDDLIEAWSAISRRSAPGQANEAIRSRHISSVRVKAASPDGP